MKVKSTLFGCFYPPGRPNDHKYNSVFFNTIILNSDEVFAQVGTDHDEFRAMQRKLFSGAKGAQIHAAIQKLYTTLRQYPGLAPLVNAIMNTAQNAVSLDGVADEEEMELLRDRWLRRVNNAPSDNEQSEADSASGNLGQGFITLPIFIATNRDKIGGHVTRFFGTGRAPEVSWAVMWLSLPDSHGYGETDGTTWRYSAKRSGAPPNKIVHLTTVPLEESCVNHISDIMNDIGEKECIVFTHGYNTTIANACKRMAQIAYAGNFRGPSFVFSWPSNQSMTAYTADEANVMWAVPDFMKTLRFVMISLGMEKVHLLAHSMGSRLALYSLLRMHPADMPPGAAKIGRVVLAAPDFDMGEFMYLADDITKRCERLTLYCSAEDQALHLSKSLHGGHPRLGDFRGFLEMASHSKMKALEKVDAIDTTGTDNSWLRHAYVFDACGIIMDCCLVLRAGMLPHERTSLVLTQLPSGLVYWTFQTTSTGVLNPASLKSTTQLILNLGRALAAFGSNKFGMQDAFKVAADSAAMLEGLEGSGPEKGESVKDGPADGEEDGSTGGPNAVVEEGRPGGDGAEDNDEAGDEVGEELGLLQPRPTLRRLASTRFMDEFAIDLRSPTVGGTQHVENEDVEDMGGNDVKLPSDAEVALTLDSPLFQRTFSRSRTFAAKSSQGLGGLRRGFGGHQLRRQHHGGPKSEKEAKDAAAYIQSKVDETVAARH